MLSLFSTINLISVLETNILGRTYSNLNNIFKDFNIQYLCEVYCNELEQYLMQFDAIEKKCNTSGLQIWAFKNCNKWTLVYKDYWRWKFWINAHTSIENQSNQDWNTPTHLKNGGPHIKVSLIFWFLIMIFCLCFYHQWWVKLVLSTKPT